MEITPEDVAAIQPILDTLEVRWWEKDQHRNALALAYASGRVSVISEPGEPENK